jgi:hypothetical protein
MYANAPYLQRRGSLVLAVGHMGNKGANPDLFRWRTNSWFEPVSSYLRTIEFMFNAAGDLDDHGLNLVLLPGKWKQMLKVC